MHPAIFSDIILPVKCNRPFHVESLYNVRKGFIVVLITVISLLRSALSRLIGLGVICILFQSSLSIKWLTSSLSTILVTIHFLLALTDSLNDAIPFSLDGTSPLTLSALNLNPQGPKNGLFIRRMDIAPVSNIAHAAVCASSL